MANHTQRRGRGFGAKSIRISALEGAEIRKILMARHGYSAEEAFAGIVSGELATVLLFAPSRVADWIAAQPAPDDPALAEDVASLVQQLAPARP